jgi:ABC-type nickel/cobalt efflux system permease component RcnA
MNFIVLGLVLSVFVLGGVLILNSSLLDPFTIYVQSQQTQYHRELAAVLREVQEKGAIAMWGMVSLSFLYGIFHAAGPGHGKAVIGTYLLSNERALRRGITLAFLSAFMQGVTAISLIMGAVYVLGWTRRQASEAVPSLELASYVMIVAIGVLLMVRGLRAAIAKNRKSQPHVHDHTHDHVGHAHEACSDCGHVHAPDPHLLSKDANWKESLSIIISIGIRPCTGSLLVLVFAEALDLRWSGILSVLAISLGTAITVSCLAVFAVYFRKMAAKMANTSDSPYLEYASLGVTIAGGMIITLFGVTLFMAASGQNHPLL